MTVTGKVNTLVIAIAVIAGCAMVGYSVVSEYRNTMDRIVEQSSAAVQSRPQLQLDIYYRDSAALGDTLQQLTDRSTAIAFALVLDPAGQPLASRVQSPGGGAQLPSLSLMRGDASPLATVVVGRPGPSGGLAAWLIVFTI